MALDLSDINEANSDEIEEFKRHVYQVAKKHQKLNQWCNVVDVALRDLDITEVAAIPLTFELNIPIKATFSLPVMEIKGKTEDEIKELMIALFKENSNGYKPIQVSNQAAYLDQVKVRQAGDLSNNGALAEQLKNVEVKAVTEYQWTWGTESNRITLPTRYLVMRNADYYDRHVIDRTTGQTLCHGSAGNSRRNQKVNWPCDYQEGYACGTCDSMIRTIVQAATEVEAIEEDLQPAV
jgi:hypothetical protein